MTTFKLFDAHFHIIDPHFPLVANHGYVPDAFTCGDYLSRMQHQPLMGGAVVSGSFQALDQSYLFDALAKLGRNFVGVTQVPAAISDARLQHLHAMGVRALRFNVRRGGSEHISQLDYLARRVHALLGWHVELYIDSRELDALYGTLIELPALSIDHLGLSKAGLPSILRLAEHGVRIKATGFGRVDFDIKAALRDIHAANPQALMFGTDLPSTRAARPYRDDDIQLVIDALGIDDAQRVFYQNAVEFYRLTTNQLTGQP